MKLEPRSFESLVALRYLTARRKQAMISIITLISVGGIAAGVMALVIALAVTTGFRNTVQSMLLGAYPHVIVMEKEVTRGIEDWRGASTRLSQLDSVRQAAPALYGVVMYSGPLQSAGGNLKGILPPSQARPPEALRKLKEGGFTDWKDAEGYPPIILGSRLAQQTGMTLNSIVRVLSPRGEPTPFGPKLVEHRFRVTGIFESGFYDLDNQWGFASLEAVQRVLSINDVVTAVELSIADPYQAPRVAEAAEKAAGPGLGATHWMEQNKQLLSALRLEKVGVVIIIGLIQMVAALNILTSLIMMVMEKHRDIAILMSMGARREQIGRIFRLQGVAIGVAGTILGLAAGYSISYFCKSRQWPPLDETVYSLSFVPFEPRWFDALWISAVAIGVSYLATLYPARTATRIAPAEALRYE